MVGGSGGREFAGRANGRDRSGTGETACCAAEIDGREVTGQGLCWSRVATCTLTGILLLAKSRLLGEAAYP